MAMANYTEVSGMTTDKRDAQHGTELGESGLSRCWCGSQSHTRYEHFAPTLTFPMGKIECDICGDTHPADAHGEPLVIRDTDARSTVAAVKVHLDDARVILEGRGMDVHLNDLERDWEEASADDRDEYAPEYLDDLDAILADAGFVAVTDPYAASWAVYRAVPSSVDTDA